MSAAAALSAHAATSILRLVMSSIVTASGHGIDALPMRVLSSVMRVLSSARHLPLISAPEAVRRIVTLERRSTTVNTGTILIGLAIDLVVILTLVFAVYRPRHSKADLALSYIVLNLGVFGAVALLSGSQSGLALGMGLFGILSIIRLRSTAISQTEVAYYFVALVLGLVNSLGSSHLPLAIAINVLLVGTLALLDRGAKAISATATEKRRIVLDVIHEDPAVLRADLRSRLRTELRDVTTEEIDYVRDVMVLVVEVDRPVVPESDMAAEDPSPAETPVVDTRAVALNGARA